MKTLGLDLGGTKIAAAVVENGKILSRVRLPTPQEGFEAVIAALAAAAKQASEGHIGIARVGLGSPGPIDFEAGKVLFAPNIAGMQDASLVARLEECLELEVVLENDANAAGYAEHLYGAARDLENSIYVTISTGIGGGLFLGERVLHGANGIAGEIGHMTLQADGPLCGCGHYGCWEAIASGRAVARDGSYSYGLPLTTEDVFARATAGESRALRIIDNAARYTGIGIANLLKAFDPDGFVIGGGMSQVGAFYLDRIQASA
ncbi:MAG TPA: ROK family protein, partial [Trueperaceae bacterium]